MKKKLLSLLLPLLFTSLYSCNPAKPTVSIRYEGDSESVKFGIQNIKEAMEKNNLSYVDKDGEYQITIHDIDTALQEQEYAIDVEGKSITLKGGDETGLMYGALQIAENIEINDGITALNDYSEKAYIEKRSVAFRPILDMRSPSYTNNADSARWNFENSWNLDFWKGFFDIMAKMRYNMISFNSVNDLPSMIKVDGYEDCALEDIWEYTGEYDDSYMGNATDMFRQEQIDSGNYRVFKKMTIDEKIAYWHSVFQAAHNRGIKIRYETMHIYTYYENGKYGITDRRDNPVTVDYFSKAYSTFLKEYTEIDFFGCGKPGENMDYEKGTELQTDQYIYNTIGYAGKKALEADPNRKIVIDVAMTDTNKELWANYPVPLAHFQRYNDTHLYVTTKTPQSTVEALQRLNPNWKAMMLLKEGDQMHFTWGDMGFVREFCKNLYHENSWGYTWGADVYYTVGKEYEFVDESLNGDYYYNRHFINYTLFGRLSFNPDLTDEYLNKVLYSKFEGVAREHYDIAINALKEASMVIIRVNSQHCPGGTDSAWYPETCQSHPNLFGYLDVRRFVNSTAAAADGDVVSIGDYAKAIAQGTTTFEKYTPFENVDMLRKFSSKALEYVNQYKGLNVNNIKLNNIVLDQESVAALGLYYADLFEGATNLRLYNDTKDTSYQDKAITLLTSAYDNWVKYANLFTARYKQERFARHGIVDPKAYNDAVKKNISYAQKWAFKN